MQMSIINSKSVFLKITDRYVCIQSIFFFIRTALSIEGRHNHHQDINENKIKQVGYLIFVPTFIYDTEVAFSASRVIYL